MKPSASGPPGGSFYDQYRAIEDNIGMSPKQRVEAEVALLETWLGDVKAMCVSLLDKPDHAILETPLGVYVTKYRDVVEVFQRDDVFSVQGGYGERMAISSGSFMLGMDQGAIYERENALTRLAMPQSDLPSVARWVRQYAADCVSQIASTETTIDIAQEIGYRVPTAFVGHYYGVPGPSQDAWVSWLQMLALFIFNFWAGGSPFKEEASATGLKFQTYINNTIRQREAAIRNQQDVPDDALTRMINAAIANPVDALDEIAIRRNLGGLSIGCTMPPSGTFIFAIDKVMSLKDTDPATFDMIVRSAVDDDTDLLSRCMLEAARLASPVPPTLFRTALQDYVLAKGTPRAKTIAAGSTVILVPSSAMMDPEMIDEPNAFRIDRPLWSYVHFGEGMHQCLGREIGKILLTESARAVLKLPNLRRASGAAGQIVAGSGLPGSSYPAHLLFDFNKR
jgi:cytochrome P450